MNPVEAQAAREAGIRLTVDAVIDKIGENWSKRLSRGHEDMWVTELEAEAPEVVELVVKHFKKLGYGFEKEKYNGYAGPYEVYRMRIVPRPPREPSLLSQFFTRILGGQHAR